MFSIDYKNRKPLYLQLVENIESLAARGVLPPESQLPSVRAMAMELSINPNTIQKAYADLESRGVIYTLPGRGAFISPSLDKIIEMKRTKILNCISALCAEAAGNGFTKEDFLGTCASAFDESVRKLEKNKEGHYDCRQ